MLETELRPFSRQTGASPLRQDAGGEKDAPGLLSFFSLYHAPGRPFPPGNPMIHRFEVPGSFPPEIPSGSSPSPDRMVRFRLWSVITFPAIRDHRASKFPFCPWIAPSIRAKTGLPLVS
jgi:hypothetical protein